MQITKKSLPKSIVELEITVPYADIDNDLDRAAAELSKEFEVPGFRPGKAPRAVIEKSMGITKLLESAVRHTIARTLPLAAEQEGVAESIGRPEVLIVRLVPDQDVVYQARITVMPHVSLKQADDIRVERKQVSVAPEKLEKLLQDLRKMRAHEVAVTRPVARGDKVLMDMNIKIASVSVEGGQQTGMILWVGEDNMIPGFEEKIIGATIGQALQFELPFPDTYHAKNLAGKTGEFEVTIRNIFEITLPEITDEFVRGLGSFKTVDDLKLQLEKNLREEAEAEEEYRVEKELLTELSKRAVVEELPDILVESEQSRMHEELQQSLTDRGVSYEQWLINLKKSPEDVKGDLLPQALERVKTMLAIRQLARDQNIIVSESDIDEEINALLAHYPGQKDIEERVRHDDYRDVLRGRILNRKVIEWLKEHGCQPRQS